MRPGTGPAGTVNRDEAVVGPVSAMPSNGDLALQFLKTFCAGDIDALAPLLTDDLQFTAYSGEVER